MPKTKSESLSPMPVVLPSVGELTQIGEADSVEGAARVLITYALGRFGWLYYDGRSYAAVGVACLDALGRELAPHLPDGQVIKGTWSRETVKSAYGGEGCEVWELVA